jgi:ribosome-associated toxin RatA of RatAB toxin-antitoxin module
MATLRPHDVWHFMKLKTVQQSVLIWYSAQEMFDLVVDVARYPQFLPWCDHAEVVQHLPDGMIARIGMQLGGLKKSFTTHNTHQPGRQVALALVDGPFKALNGTWDFTPMGEERACKVELQLSYRFDSMFGGLVAPVFDRIASTLVNAFVERAHQVYGE